jgi:hypothetical protein
MKETAWMLQAEQQISVNIAKECPHIYRHFLAKR